MIQQFRDAPSAYIFFVHELVQTFVDIRRASKMLSKIFHILKHHFWNTPKDLETMPLQLRPNLKSEVNIETEHMALFFHYIMKEAAIYKIMKSAQQTLEEDSYHNKATLAEYRIFITIIEMYKRIYAHCKMCFNKALIKQKFENKDKGKNGQKKGCTNKNCSNCYPKQEGTPECKKASDEEEVNGKISSR
jgi:hypothetical protein